MQRCCVPVAFDALWVQLDQLSIEQFDTASCFTGKLVVKKKF